MEWEMVSKAALRSRSMRIERKPLSADRSMSLVTLMSAVSVLCDDLLPRVFPVDAINRCFFPPVG